MRNSNYKIEHLELNELEIEALREHTGFEDDGVEDKEDEIDELFSEEVPIRSVESFGGYPEHSKVVVIRKCTKCGLQFDAELGSKKMLCDNCERVPVQQDKNEKDRVAKQSTSQMLISD